MRPNARSTAAAAAGALKTQVSTGVSGALGKAALAAIAGPAPATDQETPTLMAGER